MAVTQPVESRLKSVQQLQSILDRFLLDKSKNNAAHTPYIHRFKVFIGACSVLEWISHQSESLAMVYWRSRDGAFESAGLGVLMEKNVDHLTDLQACIQSFRQYLSQDIRAYHIIQFGSGDGAPLGRFFIPSVELIQDHTGTYLCANVLVGDRLSASIQHAKLILSSLQFEFNPISIPALANPILYSPTHSEWLEYITLAQNAIQSTSLTKLVLARTARLELERPISGYALLSALSPEFMQSYAFGFNLGDAQFIGVSPERLFYKKSTRLYSEAIAGTRPRGQTAQEDAQLEAELISSQKDRVEHDAVLDMIRSHFLNWCHDYSEASCSVLKLSNVQHLLVQHSGTLMADLTEEAIYTLLHPTPAISGNPSKSAVEFIETHEPFKRHYYCGTVGWLTQDESEFVVSIRSAWVQASTCLVYAGAGVVSESDPEKEWEELNHKSALYTRLFVDAE